MQGFYSRQKTVKDNAITTRRLLMNAKLKRIKNVERIYQ